MPLSRVSVNEYRPYTQELYKHRSKWFGNKPFTTLHHCFAMLKVNEKWARRNFETTLRRLRLRISVSTDLKDDGEGDMIGEEAPLLALVWMGERDGEEEEWCTWCLQRRT